MTLLVPITLFGWIPAVLFIFALLPSRRAVIVSFLTAWLFLPMAGFPIEGLPDYTKMTATCAGVILATLLFAPDRLLSFRPRWLDLPMAVWCLVPLCSSLANGLGPYDGASGVLHRVVEWGFPYLIGRLYFRDMQGLRELAVGVFIGGLIYVPLCLYEIKMSPQLHNMVYGFHPHTGWLEVRRGGGWRPTVFMQHGLMVGMWMATTALVGVWLWRTGVLRRLWGFRTGGMVLALLATAVLCKSTGATVLMIVGIGLLLAVRRWCRMAPFWVAVIVPAVYLGARTVGGWNGAELVSSIKLFSEDRAGSLQCRFDNEVVLGAHALDRPFLGWGGWGRNRVVSDETGEDNTITDSLWIIALGINGLVGLAALTAILLVPPALLLWRLPAIRWADPECAGAAALAVVLVMYEFDTLFNAMFNPIFILVAGALSGLLAVTLPQRVRQPVGASRRARPRVRRVLRGEAAGL